MPIATRTLTKLANREDIGPGIKRWRVDGVDGRGNPWVHGPFFGTQAEGETIRDTCWTAEQLAEQDEKFGYQWILDGNAIIDYVPDDITQTEWRTRIVRRWWNTRIENITGDDLRIFCTVSEFVAGFTAAQIAGFLGITLTQANKGLARAIDLRDTTCPAIFASDAEQEPV